MVTLFAFIFISSLLDRFAVIKASFAFKFIVPTAVMFESFAIPSLNTF